MTAAIARNSEVVPTGLPFGSVRWGAHLCHFYRSLEDLEEVVVPYFAAGIANHEKCIWIANTPLTAGRALAMLGKRVTDLDARMRDGQIVVVDRSDWLTRTGVLESERRIEHWLERERVAISDGFSGLRITGDTTWVESSEWRALAAHEARLHRALQGRRITALCSYTLDRCGPSEIIDVLRNHKSALLRRDGKWEHIGSATAALALMITVPEVASRAHTVEFFEAAEFPASSMARRLTDALAQGKAAGALCARAHLAEIVAAIEKRMDPAPALAEGRLMLLDADSIYDAAIAAPDFEAAVDAYVGSRVREVVAKFKTARFYGELVDVACQHGRRDLAMRLEHWWNRQLETLPIELHCGYSVTSFDDVESIHDFRHVCDEHGYVFARRQIGASDPDRLAAELQQVSSILEAEAARRAEAESAATGSREHLVVLQRITSALGEAVTFDNVGSVVSAEVAPAVTASRVGLVIAGQLITLRGITTPEDTTTLATALEHVPAQWSVKGDLPPEIAWMGGALVGVLPLVFAHDRIGTLLLGFDQATLTIAQRALVDDLVRQLSLAVERARVYEQAEKDRVRAERASSAKDQLLAMLGHELRNPLSPILSATQLMRLRSPDVLTEERATIERSVTHMIRLVDDLLDVAQISRGELALAREPSDVGEVVQQAIDLARTVTDDRVQIAVEIPHQLIVDVDRARMKQVIANLVINATKYTSDRAIEVSARAHGDVVEIIVRDHGVGIDRELLPYVFELFVQGKQGDDRARGGLGVGLAIAKSIVELHGGTITATSDGPGRGAAFAITLSRWQTERTTDQITVPSIGGRRILVVDDNEDAAWLLAEALRLLGHEVRIAHEGSSALALARAWKPEIALLDIGLPGMNGFDLCRELGKLLARPYTIAVSGYGQPKDRAEAREAGFDAHFVKPVDLRDVQAAIEAFNDSN